METPVSFPTDLRRRLVAALASVALIAPAGLALAQQPGDPQRRPTPQQQQQQRPQAKPPATKPAAKPPAKTESMTPSQIGIPTLAKQAFMVDPMTGAVLLSKDADRSMPPSSMSKMMTVYILFEELAAGRVKLDTRFKVSERARKMGGSRMFLEITSEPTVEELIRGIIIQSGNDACVVVAEALSGTEDAFAERMTKRGREMGMQRSVFKNSSGWPAEGQFTTARDLAVLSWRTIEDFPRQYRYYAEPEWAYNNIRQENRNRLLRTTPGTDGLKTGHTDEGGYGIAVSTQRDGRRLVLVVNGLASMNERASESHRLIEWAFREFTNTVLFKAGDVVTEAPVWLGRSDKVPLRITRSAIVTSPVGQAAQPRVVARFEGPLAAPVAKGTRVGTVAITLADGRVFEHPLEVGEDVPRLGTFGRIGVLARHYLLGWLS
ncbi:MAG: D-alanyl-D-alanine carboxypeptidase [Alphaproteobacteria bacterium]|nr:D-alanyl-D-alanine carboxypeptidase [Alphaproteobacteria bacterium]